MRDDLPIWRSLLFVPAHIEKFVLGAPARGADAYILDLEDSVPIARKDTARRAVVAGAQAIAHAGGTVLVRINSDSAQASADIDASVDSAIRALVIPKARDEDSVRAIATRVDALERQRGMKGGHTLFIAQIEGVHALLRLDEIATSSLRVMGMMLGTEDLCASAGMQPILEALLGPAQQVVFACVRAGIAPFGLPGSIADHSDLEAWRRLARLSRKLGFVGAPCVHPNQVAILNEEFTPSATELEEARELLAAYERAQRLGRGACEHRGRMIDAPVVARAQQLLRRAERFS